VLVVGELNPYGADPRAALYHLPRGASGDRLRVLLGLSDSAYARRLAKVNLCTGRWDIHAARARAAYLLDTSREEVIVLLGARVRDAFHRGPDFFNTTTYHMPGFDDRILLGLPHPSGRCLVWNDPAARRRATEALRALAPWIYHEAVGDAARSTGRGVEGP
jgi:hypothetical protein